MDLIIIMLAVLCVIAVCGFYTLFIIRHIEYNRNVIVDALRASDATLMKSIDKVHVRIDSLFTIDPSAPNEATKTDPDVSDLSEQNMYIPDNVKFEVEGGTDTPIEYEIQE